MPRNYHLTGLPECKSLTQDQQRIIQSNVVYEKRTQEELITYMGLTKPEHLSYVEACFKNAEKLRKKFGLYEPQFIGEGF